MTDLQRRIAYYVSRLDDDSAARHEVNGYTWPVDTHRADYISEKWCRIVRISHSGTGFSEPRVSVRAFVALIDYHTKTLGVIKAGNIHKPHGWKAPARTLHGNLLSFDPPADFTPVSTVIDKSKPKRRERTRLLASTIRNEIATQIGVPKVRLRVRWDRDALIIHVIDTTKEEMAVVLDYALQHKTRFGVSIYCDDDNQLRDCVYVFEDGEHEDGVLDTHEAIKVLDSLR